ncbi:hypothetical protein DFH09DRAFT_1456687 [Mycena vulgaris]|nr:hypothetical protein DFH09DRAFT_1456687 [Mycena vulgaris]
MTTQLEPSLAREKATPLLSSRVARPPPYILPCPPSPPPPPVICPPDLPAGRAHKSAPTRLYLSVRRVLAALIARPDAILSPNYMQSAVPLRVPRAVVCSFVSSFRLGPCAPLTFPFRRISPGHSPSCILPPYFPSSTASRPSLTSALQHAFIPFIFPSFVRAGPHTLRHSTNEASPWRHASRPRTRAALAWHCHCVELDEPEKFRASARVALHGSSLPLRFSSLLHLHLPSALPPLPRRLRPSAPRAPQGQRHEGPPSRHRRYCRSGAEAYLCIV